MKTDIRIVNAVAGLYKWIDSQVADFASCGACGKCCDFDAYDHRLFITTPELLYFINRMSPEPIKQMPSGQCPYQIENKCTAHPHRFAACRIFACKENPDLQSKLSEQTIEKLKSICQQFDTDYRYMDLKTALNQAT